MADGVLQETLRGVLDNRSLMGYFAGDQKSVDASKQKLVLIMDEVDGMSAGDRGGVGQLAAVCRKTQVRLCFLLVYSTRNLIIIDPHHLHLQRTQTAKDEAVRQCNF